MYNSGVCGRPSHVSTAPPPRPIHRDAVSAACFCGTSGELATGGKDLGVALSMLDPLVVGGGALPPRAVGGRATGVVCSGHTREVSALHWAGPTNRLFSGSRDKAVRQWDLGSGQETQILTGHAMAVIAVTSTGQGNAVVSGSRDGTLIMWDVECGEILREAHVNRNVVTSLTHIPGTDLLLQGSEDKMLRIWEASTLRPRLTFPRQQYFQSCCAAADDGNLLLTGSNGFNGSGCFVTLWDRRRADKHVERAGHLQGIAACAFLPGSGGPARYCTASTDGTIKLWRDGDADAIAAIDLHSPGGAQTLAVTVDREGGGVLAVGGVSGDVTILRCRDDFERVGPVIAAL